MILRFKTQKAQDNTDFLNINFSAECYNLGETPKRNYIEVTKAGYNDILAELDFNSFGYSESLETKSPEDFHPFLKSDLNKMCLDCKHLYILCDGTKDKVYSDCVWKTAPASDLEEFNQETNNNLKRGRP